MPAWGVIMRMGPLIRLCPILAVLSAAQPEPPADAIEREKAAFEKAQTARYMEQRCSDGERPEWPGFKLQHCAYTLKDSLGREVSARVFLADPSPERLARWVVSACLETVGRADVRCTSAIRRRIIGQSGGQFPVAGVVLEDILGPSGGPDGILEGYCFRDGVTIVVAGFANGTALSQSPSDMELDACIQGPIIRVRRFARLQGTTVGMYKANGGTEDVGTDGKENQNWPVVIRRLYQHALQGDHNELLVAWARANRSQL